MDDVPASPASPEPLRPSLSVVVPVRNGGRDFGRCLQRLRDSYLANFELIVVDDGSTDHSAAMARQAGAIVVCNPKPQGPAAARNLGAKAASACFIFFLDADVAVHPETLGRALARFDADPGLAALFGSYDDTPAARGLVSQYRNLLHHFVHQNGPFLDNIRPAHTFWTGCGIIRRDLFLEFGGFDPRLYPRPAIEDIELGYRLTRAGHRIVLARDVLATHMKRWTLREMVRTDIFQRRRTVDAPDQANRYGRDRPERQGQSEGMRRSDGIDVAGRPMQPHNPLGRLRGVVGTGGDRCLESPVLRIPRPPTRNSLRLCRTAAPDRLLLLLRAFGRDRHGPLAMEPTADRSDAIGSYGASRSRDPTCTPLDNRPPSRPIHAQRAEDLVIAGGRMLTGPHRS